VRRVRDDLEEWCMDGTRWRGWIQRRSLCICSGLDWLGVLWFNDTQKQHAVVSSRVVLLCSCFMVLAMCVFESVAALFRSNTCNCAWHVRIGCVLQAVCISFCEVLSHCMIGSCLLFAAAVLEDIRI